MVSELRHGVVGLPKSGKTTFLAALWHLVTADEVDVGLVCRSMRGDASYLTKIAECWRRCESMERTRSLTAAYVTLQLTDASNGMEFDLCFPDIAGESFDNQLMTRQLERAHADWLEHAGGTLLFLSADARPDGQRLGELDGLLDVAENDQATREESTHLSEISATDADAGWTSKMMTEQAKLVELLQITQRLDGRDLRRRIAVVISAWDLIDSEGLSPEAWLERERPLLWQFIASNCTDFEARVFGVSAQGGQVEVTAERDALLDKSSPSERIVCVNGEIRDHDLTRPIRWLHNEKATS